MIAHFTHMQCDPLDGTTPGARRIHTGILTLCGFWQVRCCAVRADRLQPSRLHCTDMPNTANAAALVRAPATQQGTCGSARSVGI